MSRSMPTGSDFSRSFERKLVVIMFTNRSLKYCYENRISFSYDLRLEKLTQVKIIITH